MRRFLRERLPVEQIAMTIAGQNIYGLQCMFLAGVEFKAKQQDQNGERLPPQPTSKLVEKWERVLVATGVELHLRTDLARLKPTELRQLMDAMEKALRKCGV